MDADRYSGSETDGAIRQRACIKLRGEGQKVRCWQEAGDEASWQRADKNRKWAKRQGQERVIPRQDGRQGPSELVLVPTWIR